MTRYTRLTDRMSLGLRHGFGARLVSGDEDEVMLYIAGYELEGSLWTLPSRIYTIQSITIPNGVINLTGKERILAAFERREADRPPYDFWAEEVTINRLGEYLGYHDINRFLKEMDVDVRSFQSVEPPFKRLQSGFYENIWGERFTYRETGWGPMREDTYGALNEAQSMDDIVNHPWPSNDIMNFGHLKRQFEAARAGGYAIRYGYGDIWQRALNVRGMENHLLDMIVHPEWVHYMSRKLTDFYLRDYSRAWEISGGNIDFFFICSDIGTQNGPLISIPMFKEFLAPYIREIADLVHGFGSKLLYHTCGDVSAFIPAIIACDIDILNPLQPAGPGMRPEALRQWADRLVFHGGIDVQHLLPFKAPGEIQDTVRRYANTLGPGYIVASTHFFQPDTPPENIVAMYQAF